MHHPRACLVSTFALTMLLSSVSFDLLAKDGGSCRFSNEVVLVQIKAMNKDQYILSTMTQTSTLDSTENIAERLFTVPAHKIEKNLSKSHYLVATIKHNMSGACPPQQVVHVEKFSLGKLQLQIDEKLYYGGMFRFDEAKNCIESKRSGCKALQLPTYNSTEVKVMYSISAQTLKACSLSAIRKNIDKLENISSQAYILACAFNKKNNMEFILYFEKINGQLAFRGGLF